MRGDPYRDPQPAPTKRRIEADETIASCEAKLGELGLLVLPEELRARVARLRSVGEDASPPGRASGWAGAGVGLESAAQVNAFMSSSHWMGTSVPSGLPEVFIRREGLADAMMKAIRVRTEAQIGDALFDSAFYVEDGRPGVLRELFTPDLRAAFLARADVGDFTFRLRDADASLAWKTVFPSGLVSADVAARSIELLVALRDALGRLQLVRTP